LSHLLAAGFLGFVTGISGGFGLLLSLLAVRRPEIDKTRIALIGAFLGIPAFVAASMGATN
jgi:hypothetical protein